MLRHVSLLQKLAGPGLRLHRRQPPHGQRHLCQVRVRSHSIHTPPTPLCVNICLPVSGPSDSHFNSTTSRNVASPSKLAGELLKSPTRTRTRSRQATATAGRTRGALNGLADPFVDAADVFDKENAPIPTRASRARTASTAEPQKGKAKAKTKLVEAVDEEPSSPLAKPTRKVLGDLNVHKDQAKSSSQAAKPPTRKATRKDIVSDEDSVAIDASLHAQRSPDETIPRASTPPVLASPPKPQAVEEPQQVTQVEQLDAISVIDSDEDDSEAESDAEAVTALTNDQPGTHDKHAEPTETSTLVSQVSRSDNTTVSFQPDTNDTVRSTDNTVSGTLVDPKLESARQAASALLTRQKDANAEKPVKRTLASYGAKKSLPATAHNARPSNATTTIHPASTPAGPGFRSSFLNKSLRKQIADQEALDSEESESDSDADEAGLVAGATFAAMYKKTAANTQANTRANAGDAASKNTTLPSANGANSKKRKSDEALPAASEAGLGSAAPPTKMSKLGAAMLAAKAQSSAPTPATAKKAPAVGPASKLEQFRNNLAHVARSTGSGASTSSNSASQSVSSVASPAVTDVAKASQSTSIPAAAVEVPKAPASSDDSTRSSDSGSDSTEKIVAANKSGESTITASAIPRSPVRSPSRAAAASPVRLPPRTGSVRKSPRKLAEQQKATQQESARSVSPGPKVKEAVSLFESSRIAASNNTQAPRSPTTQPRSLAALFGSPKQSSKLPTLSSAAGGSTTPAHSPPKNWKGSRLPFAQPLQLQPQAPREADKSLPQTPIEESAEPSPKEAVAGQRIVSSASTVLSTSKAEADSQFFDARSRENTPEPVVVPSAPATVAPPKDALSSGTDVLALETAAKKEAPALVPAPVVATKTSSPTKASSLSPKKVAAKALAKAGPTSPTKASALRAAANAASPSKSKSQSSARTAQQSGVPAPSASPSRGWGIGEKLKGFLGLHASTTTNPSTSAAQTKISASSTFQPRSNGVPTSTANAAVVEPKAAPAPAVAAAPPPTIPGALLASPPPASKTPQVHSTPSSAAASAVAPTTTTTNGKLNSIARAELLRKKQAEEEERKAKEKEERRRMLMAKKEERAKAVAEEELEKENRKRAREQNDRAGRSGADDVSMASSAGGPAAIPAALLGNIVIGGSAASGSSHSASGSSRTSAVSSVSSGPPTRPSSALNGSYAGVKSRYMQSSVQPASEDSNKKRRVTNDKEGGATAMQPSQPSKQQQQAQQQQASGARPGTLAASSQIGAPKMVRTVSQSSIRAGPPSQVATQQQQQQRAQQQAGAPPPPPQQIKLAMKSGAAAAAGFGAAPRIPGAGGMAGNGAATASMMAAAAKAALGSASTAPQPTAKSMANANFSSSNPFQQAKQQQLQMQMQKQKQLQLQQQQQQQAASNVAQAQAQAAAANAAALREQELHRAAKLQFQTQNAAGGRFDEWGDDAAHAGDGGADEALPDIASEYSDSEDEETIQKRAAMPSWTQGDALDAALLAQSTVDADEIFGIPQGPVELEKILPGERTANRIRRPRTSSANWSGPDGLAQWEIDRYNKRMGIQGAGVQLARRDGSHPPPPPPGVMARLSMAQRQSMSHHSMGPSSSLSSSSAAAAAGTHPNPAANKKDDARGKL